MSRLVAALVLLLPVAAFAADELTASGLTLGPGKVFITAQDNPSFLPVPVVLDTQGRLIKLPYAGGVECWDISGATSTRINALTSGGPSQKKLVGAKLGSDAFVVVAEAAPGTWDLTRGGCGVASTAIGSLALSGALVPNARRDSEVLSPVLSNGDLVYGASGGLARLTFGGGPAASLWVSNATLDAALGTAGLPAAGSGMTVEGPLVVALGASPDDHVWAVVERRWGDVSLQLGQRFAVELDGAGVVTVRHGPDPVRRWGSSPIPTTRAIYDATLDAMLLGIQPVQVGANSFLTLAVQPRARVPAGQPPRLAWPRVEDLKGDWGERFNDVYPSTAGYAVRRTPAGLRRIGVQKGACDFDRDGLRDTEEATAGTSDYFPDSDGDGVTDGAELRLYQTNPASAASVPQISTQGADVVLAPTLMPTSWEIGPECPLCFNGPENRSASNFSSGRVLCASSAPTGRGGDCFDHEGQLIFHSSGRLAPRFPPELDRGFWPPDYPLGPWRSADVAHLGGNSTQVPQTTRVYDVLPLSADVFLGTEEMSPVLRLARFGPTGRFVVIDLARQPCPILANAADTCTAERYAAGIRGFEIVGYDPLRKLGLVAVRSDAGNFLLGVGATGVVHLGDLMETAQGNDVVWMARLPAGGFITQTTSSGLIRGSLRLDDALRPIASAQRTLRVSNDREWGNFYRNGFTTIQNHSLLTEAFPSGQGAFGCTAQGMGSAVVMQCGGDFTLRQPIVQVIHALHGEWVPVPAALGRGEVVLWAYQNGSQTSNQDVQPPEEWALWRVTPVGAVAVWLGTAQFVSALDAAGKASVAATKLGVIDSIGASPSGERLCLAEPAAGRLWELTLDPATRKLAGITLQTPAGGVRACGYDEANALAWVGASPKVLHSAEGEVALGGDGQARGLIRVEGRWVVPMEGFAARCVSGGADAEAPYVAVAASEGLGRLAWVDTAGRGYLATAEGFCSGAAPSEQLHDLDLQGNERSVWLTAYYDITYRSVNSARAAMAVRPDGVVFLGAQQLSYGGLGEASSLTHKLLFGLLPTYHAATVASRTPAADPFRAKKAKAFIAATEPGAVVAMALVPGAPPDTDFGHLVRPKPVVVVDPPDAGEESSPPTEPDGCGCNAAGGGSATFALALAVAVVARRRFARR